MSESQGPRVVEDRERVRQLGSALRKTGRPVALVAVGGGARAGPGALGGAGGRKPRSVVVVATAGDPEDPLWAKAGADVVVPIGSEGLYPRGERTLVTHPDEGLEPADEIARAVTARLSLIGLLSPSDVYAGEKDYEALVATQHAVTDLNLPVAVHGVPTVRTPKGLAVSRRNALVAPAERERAEALAAAVTAGAHVAERGLEVVLETASGVLEAAGVEPEYLALRAPDLSPAPTTGEARLLVAAPVGGVRLIDNAGVPLGIGFANLPQG